MNNFLRRSITPTTSCLFVSSTIFFSHEKDERKNYYQPSHNNLSTSWPLSKLRLQNKIVHCDANVKPQEQANVGFPIKPTMESIPVPTQQQNAKEKEEKSEDKEEDPQYNNLFPLRQLMKPKVEYPLWDEDWDGRALQTTGDRKKDHEHKRYIRKNGVTRHIILIRHGQYDETHKEDEKRLLTPLGRKQAELTGQRLAKMIQGFDTQFGPCNVKTIHVSNMARAKETADIIKKSLPDTVVRAEPNPDLNEGRPCHHIPGGRVSERAINGVDEGHERIEKAFLSFFYRSDPPVQATTTDESNEEDLENKEENATTSNNDDANENNALEPHPQHEFEIMVCHANVIRYFLCRALQIPPEAWLRLCTFNCSLTYLTIRATGSVSCRMLGDIGHLGYEYSTFSMHHGFNW